MNLPATVNCKAYRGDDWQQTFRFKTGEEPIDLSGATVESEARHRKTGDVFPLRVAVSDGAVTISLPAESLPAGSYEYDIEVDEAGTVTTWVRGLLIVTRDVTNELPS